MAGIWLSDCLIRLPRASKVQGTESLKRPEGKSQDGYCRLGELQLDTEKGRQKIKRAVCVVRDRK